MHGDGQLTRGCLQAAPCIREGDSAQFRTLLAGRSQPAGEPPGRESSLSGAEPPGAGSDQDIEAQAGETVHHRADRVGAEQPPGGADVASLVSIERVGDVVVERIGRRSTRPVTLRAIRTGQPTPTQVATSGSTSSAVSMSSSAEAVMRAVPASSPGSSRVMSRRRVSMVTGAPSDASTGGCAPTRASSSASRSSMTQCWGLVQPQGEPAGHRPSAATEVVNDHHAVGRQVRSGRLDEVVGPIAASAGSRSVSHWSLARTCPVVT